MEMKGFKRVTRKTGEVFFVCNKCGQGFDKPKRHLLELPDKYCDGK